MSRKHFIVQVGIAFKTEISCGIAQLIECFLKETGPHGGDLKAGRGYGLLQHYLIWLSKQAEFTPFLVLKLCSYKIYFFTCTTTTYISSRTEKMLNFYLTATHTTHNFQIFKNICLELNCIYRMELQFFNITTPRDLYVL